MAIHKKITREVFANIPATAAVHYDNWKDDSKRFVDTFDNIVWDEADLRDFIENGDYRMHPEHSELIGDVLLPMPEAHCIELGRWNEKGEVQETIHIYW